MKRNFEKNKLLTKKRVLLSTMATSLFFVPFVIGISEVLKNTNSLDSKKLDSINKEISYVKENSIQQNYTLEGNDSTWEVILNNGQKKIFNSPKEMRDELLKNSIINEEIYTSNLDLEKYVDSSTGELKLPNNVDFVKGDIKSNSKKIYKGLNSKVFDDENLAKQSYFKSNEAYNFNGLYFKNKNDLKDYLNNEYFTQKEIKANSIVLVGPNGVKSNSIDLNSKNAINNIDAFIETNAKKIINYKNSITNENVNITNDNIDSVLGSINTKDLGITHMQSNQGESRYIVDNDASDEFDLIGPYFYKGNLDIGSFMNKNMWKKVNGVPSQVYQESEVDKIIGSFFSSIINDDNATNLDETINSGTRTARLFRTTLNVGNKEIDDWFLDMIGEFNLDLKNEIIKTNTNLLKGKKYNTFYKIPILYSFIMQRLLNFGATQKIIDNTISYFNMICNFVQEAIELIVLDTSLLYGVDGTYFSVSKLFQIGNPEFDTNVSMQYFLQKIKNEYPALIGAMSSYLGGTNNIYLMAGLIPFSGYEQKYLIDFKIMSQQMFDSNKEKYKKIYDTFSSKEFNTLVVNFVNNSKIKDVYDLKNKNISEMISGLEKIKLNNTTSIKDYLLAVGEKNVLLYSLATASIKLEIEDYKNTKKWSSDGYLNKLYAFTGAVSWFVELVENNPDINAYEAYMAILIDGRDNGRKIFDNKESITNKLLFYKNVVRLSASVLATTAITSRIITNLYWEYNRKVFPHLRSLSQSLKHNISRGWKSIKNIMPSTMRSWKINISAPFTIRKWHVTGVFYKIDRGVDFLKSAAPILGAAMLAFEVFLLVYDLLKVETIQNFYVYTAPDGTEFIWNGGKTVSRYFGMDVQETNGISSMKLVEPIQITLPQIEEYYYFDGIKYYDPNQGKKAYIKYLLNNDISYNNNFKYKYVFDNDKNISTANSFETIDELKQSILKSLNIDRNLEYIDISKLNINSKYLSKIGYKYGNISTFNPEKLDQIMKNNFINNLLGDIRETHFAKLPQYIESDPTISIPGKVWKNGRIIEDNTNKANEYLLSNKANEVDSNNDYLIPNKQIANSESIKELKNNFIKLSNVQSKEIFATNNFGTLINNSTFDSIDKNTSSQKIYIVIKPGMGKYKFLDKSKAEKFAMGYKTIKKNFTMHKKTSYIYNGIYFKDENSLKEWIINNRSI